MEKQIKTIGVLTSGGDAPGMNAAVRAVVRTGLHKGFRMIGIQRGYNGLLNGECFEMNLRSVSNIISAGGTILYTARCLEFKTKEGQDKGAEKCRELGIPVHDGGTVVTIQGPRFSTTAESEWFQKIGWSVVNMTQYPEAWLARELGMHYVNVSLVTDYDSGLGKYAAVTNDDVLRVFNENLHLLRKLIEAMVPALPSTIDDDCTGSAALFERL